MNKTNKDFPSFKYYQFLSYCVIVPMITAIVLTYRQVELFGFTLPGGIFFAAFSFACADIIAEIYGYKYCKKIVGHLIACEIFATLAFTFVLSLPAPATFENQAAYTIVLGSSYYVVLANLSSALTGYILGAKIITRLKVVMNGRAFMLRSAIAAAVGELLYSIIWVFVAFSHTDISLSQMKNLIIAAWLYKLTFTIIMNVPATFLVKWINKAEHGISSKMPTLEYEH